MLTIKQESQAVTSYMPKRRATDCSGPKAVPGCRVPQISELRKFFTQRIAQTYDNSNKYGPFGSSEKVSQ